MAVSCDQVRSLFQNNACCDAVSPSSTSINISDFCRGDRELAIVDGNGARGFETPYANVYGFPNPALNLAFVNEWNERSDIAVSYTNGEANAGDHNAQYDALLSGGIDGMVATTYKITRNPLFPLLSPPFMDHNDLLRWYGGEGKALVTDALSTLGLVGFMVTDAGKQWGPVMKRPIGQVADFQGLTLRAGHPLFEGAFGALNATTTSQNINRVTENGQTKLDGFEWMTPADDEIFITFMASALPNETFSTWTAYEGFTVEPCTPSWLFLRKSVYESMTKSERSLLEVLANTHFENTHRVATARSEAALSSWTITQRGTLPASAIDKMEAAVRASVERVANGTDVYASRVAASMLAFV